MAKLYTKTGDKGKTGLRSGKRVEKTDKRVEAYGTLDELNSALGVAAAQLVVIPWELDERGVVGVLQSIQRDLFHLGALLAGEDKNRSERLKMLDERVGELEQRIDQLQAGSPEQRAFLLPGGSKESAFLDVARSVCRRAERRCVAVQNIDPVLLKYINRLSDFLYALARWVNYEIGVQEKEWNASFDN